jgi:DNA-binding HxlR family transcriptional regulator
MRSTLTRNDLAALGRNRWMMTLVADLAAHKGARFVELINRLGISRDSLTRTLEAGQTLGWIERNPGHGHPLRPEYILTAKGRRLALGAQRILAAGSEVGIEVSELTRWGMPIIDAIDCGHTRFNGLVRALAPATPRALSQGLRTLVATDLVRRKVFDTYPPLPDYRLSASGALIAQAFRAQAPRA